jgi:hypothetical protein
MSMKIHFISGLPRSGSTLLAAILRQNPRFRAAMSGPLCGLFESLLRGMSESNEYAMFLTERQRKGMTRSLVETFYEEVSGEKVIFDTNRGWCAQLPAIRDCGRTPESSPASEARHGSSTVSSAAFRPHRCVAGKCLPWKPRRMSTHAPNR